MKFQDRGQGQILEEQDVSRWDPYKRRAKFLRNKRNNRFQDGSHNEIMNKYLKNKRFQDRGHNEKGSNNTK